MANIRSFRELRVWQNAMDAAMRVFLITKTFPVEERYSMTSQMRRASRSVATNIAEGWRKRRYAAAFVAKLSDAEGEGAEMQTWAELARRSEYVSTDVASELEGRYEDILKQLVRMIERPDDWTIRVPSTPRESFSPRPRVSASPRPSSRQAPAR